MGAVTDSLQAPTTALLGRYDEGGRLRYAGRTTTLGAAVRHALADQLHAADADHPWTGLAGHLLEGGRVKRALSRPVGWRAMSVRHSRQCRPSSGGRTGSRGRAYR